MADVKQVIVMRKDLNMRKGKMVAQGSHAAMKFLVDNNAADGPTELHVELSPAEAQWLFGGAFTKITLGCDSEEELRELIMRAELFGIDAYPIVDSGKTEFNGVPTLTCASFGPAFVEDIDKVTGHLKPI